MHVIHEPKKYSFKIAGIRGKIFPITKLTHKTEYFLVETDKGHATTIVEHICDYIYYVLSGKGHFVINGKKESCEAGDLVVVPHESPFTYKGKLKMIATATPPFRPEQEEMLG